mmetsp:Transcript_64362/g.141898  ORF Transcript_64362/g.141898 Transcript_64362/m.141898 type:complete len:134 (-) Transcript_64362:100-501(-)
MKAAIAKQGWLRRVNAAVIAASDMTNHQHVQKDDGDNLRSRKEDQSAIRQSTVMPKRQCPTAAGTSTKTRKQLGARGLSWQVKSRTKARGAAAVNDASAQMYARAMLTGKWGRRKAPGRREAAGSLVRDGDRR